MTSLLTTPEQILAGHSSNIRSLANRLRAIVKATIPEAEERAYPGWHGIGFRHAAAGYCYGIFLLEDCVKLYFEHGKLLPDPGNLFTQRGRQTGQIVFKRISDIKKKPLQQLLLECVEFGKARRERRKNLRNGAGGHRSNEQ